MFGISSPTAKRYLAMTKEDISRLEKPNNYKKKGIIYEFMVKCHLQDDGRWLQQ